MEDLLALIIIIVFLIAIIKGGIQTFQRNWILAIIMLIFLTPIWFIWAFVEVFLSKPEKEPIVVHIKNVY
jgi:hypothetical protein